MTVQVHIYIYIYIVPFLLSSHQHPRKKPKDIIQRQRIAIAFHVCQFACSVHILGINLREVGSFGLTSDKTKRLRCCSTWTASFRSFRILWTRRGGQLPLTRSSGIGGVREIGSPISLFLSCGGGGGVCMCG